MYTNWDLPPGNSNDRQGSASVPAAIRLRGARQCAIDRCTIENIGTFAFEIDEGSTGNRFTQNKLSHVGTGGFRLDGGTEKDHPLERTGHNVIEDNVLVPFPVSEFRTVHIFRLLSSEHDDTISILQH